MLSNFPANRLNVRCEPPRRDHSRMKITIRTLRLAERHLHVNPELTHRPKTLAQRPRNPGTQPRIPLTDRPSTGIMFLVKIAQFMCGRCLAAFFFLGAPLPAFINVGLPPAIW